MFLGISVSVGKVFEGDRGYEKRYGEKD